MKYFFFILAVGCIKEKEGKKVKEPFFFYNNKGKKKRKKKKIREKRIL